MFLIKEKRKHGTNLCIVQSCRDPVTKVSKTKRIMNLGYLEDLQKQYDDPIAHFKEVARKMSEESGTESKPICVALDPTKSLNPANNLVKNYGYIALSALYHELKLDVFFRGRQRSLDINYSLNSIMKLLVYGRVLFPGSEKRLYEKRCQFFDKMEFSLDDVYRSFTYLSQYKTQLQTWIHERISENYGRDTSQLYYYVTNHYFEIGEPGPQHKNGVAKEDRLDPMVQMGLFVDKNALPVSYELFPRNRGDALAANPALKKVRQGQGSGKVIIVADNEVNSTESLYSMISVGNDYLVSQNVRSSSKEMKEYVLNQEGYTPYGDECKIKSRIFTREIRIATATGRKKIITFKEKQVVFHNAIWERWAKSEREDILQKAKDLIASADIGNKSTAYSAAKYIKGSECDRKIGDRPQDRQLHLDKERLKEEEKYDGYYLILASQSDESANDVVNAFSDLWNIEESFKLINNAFHARPTFVSRAEHINAHFLTCFVSLVLTRILEMKTQKKYPLEQMVRSLKKCTCMHIEDNYYMQSYYDSLLDHIENSLGVDFSKKYRTLSKIRENIGSTKKR